MSYVEFLASKEPRVEQCGVEPNELHPSLFPFQRDIVTWAVRKGRCAVFAGTGLGKTIMQLEWARHFAGRVLIVAPLGVTDQTIREGTRIGIEVRRVKEPDELPGIVITNYERLHKFVGMPYDAIVLDESSILKSVDGKTRTMLIEEFTTIPRRLCCTATPAPNDVAELANHAEFLGVMTRQEMLAAFFVHDADGAARAGWRLKGHASLAMYRWLAQWAVYVRRPSDLGHSDDGFVLPPLVIEDDVVPSDWRPDGMLFTVGIGGVGARSALRKQTLATRVARAKEIISSTPGQWLVWHGLNTEGEAMQAALGPDCIMIEGKDSEETKLERERAWREGKVRVLLTKSSIFGYGLNWQHCHQMMFLGMGDSWEEYYQSIRRCWRHGQKHPVSVRIVISDAEGEIAANVRSKEDEAERTAAGVVSVMRDVQIESVRGIKCARDTYEPQQAMKLPAWIGQAA